MTQPSDSEAGPDLIAAILSYWVSLVLIWQCTIELLSRCNARLKMVLQTLGVRIGLNHCSWQYCCISVQCILCIYIDLGQLPELYLWNVSSLEHTGGIQTRSRLQVSCLVVGYIGFSSLSTLRLESMADLLSTFLTTSLRFYFYIWDGQKTNVVGKTS